MSDSFTGALQSFAFDFAPRGWKLCTGGTLPASQYSALTGLLGTRWGGNGVTTVGIPDARGRISLGSGVSALTGRTFTLGDYGGGETSTLKDPSLPPHNHGLVASTNPGDYFEPTADRVLAGGTGLDSEGGTLTVKIYIPMADAGDTLKPIEGVGVTLGGTDPVSILQPGLTTSLCICLNGSYPPRPA